MRSHGSLRPCRISLALNHFPQRFNDKRAQRLAFFVQGPGWARPVHAKKTRTSHARRVFRVRGQRLAKDYAASV
ncbi:hypothetical protein Ga0080559_TMP4734 [Salipiger profundus]|uniref:Uncharacterized protein n=1 Tax=Salipiger profundus TaxID=1229727 RepID=A0A1U7DBU3_9RHOB|nr:hypothetical protein Ga0080559_TMP4734 [Salipiger profundus]